MKTFALLIFLSFFTTALLSQSSIELSFMGIDNQSPTQLDSIKIINRTQGGDTMLYWPDTVLSFYITDIEENLNSFGALSVEQNYPNPVFTYTRINIFIAEKNTVNLFVTDAVGRQVVHKSIPLDKGWHTFRFTPGNSNIYVLSLFSDNVSRAIKIINASPFNSQACKLEYIGLNNVKPDLKKRHIATSFNYEPGDQLLFVAYVDTLESAAYDSPVQSSLYTFQIANNIPCPGTEFFYHGGQLYNTIQIGNQCWMKENLNVGVMINAPQKPTDNGFIEKYCMGNYSWICDEAGGMYFWDEMMNYIDMNGGKGICPYGWHIPTDLDWKILEGAVDSDLGIGDSQWDNLNWRGENAGGMLKQTGYDYWEPPNTGASNSYGFSALAGGYYVQEDFWGPGYKGFFWSSNPTGKYYRDLDWNQQKINRGAGGDDMAFSVRCIKDQNIPQHTSPIYLFGNGTTVGWDNQNALPMAWLGWGLFARVETLSPGTDQYIKFISDLGQWAPQWGTNSSGIPDSGLLVYRPTEDEPDPNAIPVNETAGDYYIEADTANLKYITHKTSGTLYVLGDATTAEWEPDNAIVMLQETPHVFTLELPLTGGGWLKFIEVLGSWNYLWGTDETGTNEQGPIYYSASMAFPYPEELPGPDTDGVYLITVDMKTMEYTISPR